MYSKFLVPFCAVVFCVPIVFCDNNNTDNKSNQKYEMSSASNYDGKNSDFQPLADPDRKVSGAYYGIGLGISNISHKLNVGKGNGTKLSNKQSANQFDISLIGGFGAAFYDRYYAGIEFDFFKRMPKKTKDFGESGVVHKSNFGLNMDVRFGYQFPQYGTLAYVTAGFARVLGEMGAYNNGNNVAKMTFGSFFPTVGFGLEHRVNQTVNLRGDVRFTIGSKEKKEAKVNGANWTFEAKPNRYAFRISVTKNI